MEFEGRPDVGDEITPQGSQRFDVKWPSGVINVRDRFEVGGSLFDGPVRSAGCRCLCQYTCGPEQLLGCLLLGNVDDVG
jgi:hypothetical protein